MDEEKQIERAEERVQDAINSMLSLQQELGPDQSQPIFPDEYAASLAITHDLEELLESFQRRREQGNDYDLPERVDELIERQSDLADEDS